MKIDKKIILELTGYLKEFNLSEIEYAEGTTKVKVSRSTNNSNIISTEINKKQSTIEDNGAHVTSPIVGTAYLAQEPGAKKFVEVGQKITKGQTLCIIEAMKIFNEIESDFDGEIVEILVNDSTPVEFNQPIFSIK